MVICGRKVYRFTPLQVHNFQWFSRRYTACIGFLLDVDVNIGGVRRVWKSNLTRVHNAKCDLGPVYTTVEKSTGQDKKGVIQLLVEYATLDQWVFTLGEENNGGEQLLRSTNSITPSDLAGTTLRTLLLLLPNHTKRKRKRKRERECSRVTHPCQSPKHSIRVKLGGE